MERQGQPVKRGTATELKNHLVFLEMLLSTSKLQASSSERLEVSEYFRVRWRGIGFWCTRGKSIK